MDFGPIAKRRSPGGRTRGSPRSLRQSGPAFASTRTPAHPIFITTPISFPCQAKQPPERNGPRRFRNDQGAPSGCRIATILPTLIMKHLVRPRSSKRPHRSLRRPVSRNHGSHGRAEAFENRGPESVAGNFRPGTSCSRDRDERLSSAPVSYYNCLRDEEGGGGIMKGRGMSTSSMSEPLRPARPPGLSRRWLSGCRWLAIGIAVGLALFLGIAIWHTAV